MLKSLPLFIGLRYTRAKRKNHFISFISLISMLGIGLGVMVLITVLSVMNGFDRELRERILGMVPHVSVMAYGGAGLKDWETVAARLKPFTQIQNLSPVVAGQGMIASQKQTRYVVINGIDPKQEQDSRLMRNMTQGALTDLKSGEFDILLGAPLAKQLGVKLGDYVTLVTPEAALTPAGLIPRFKRFRLVGTFEVGYEYDTSLAFIDLQDAQKLLKMGDRITGVQIKLDNLFAAPRLKQEIYDYLGGQYSVSDWTRTSGNYFEAVKLEKTLMFLMLILIIAVAAFNILSALVMMVTDKQADIAILRTLGALPGTIMRIFMVQGMVIGIIGTSLGIVGGVALALNVTDLLASVERYFGVELLSADVYYISYLPSVLVPKDVLHIAIVALVLSFVATLYPAWQASRTQPAEALRYE
jgi:lipoprotein-releasing system permease protein